ncbi:MAG TPA: 4-alpha-glucanotransferase [Paracoccaceae bacterium]|nr:4-alpha-glucanotransferase [Paracoccaceae bacterium]
MGTLEELAEAHGITRHWHDLAGARHAAPPETLRALLLAMGVPAAGEAEAAEALAGLRAERAGRRLPEEMVLEEGAALAPEGPWRLELEDGGICEGGAGEAVTPPMGLHRLAVGGEEALMVVAPARAPWPPRAWGITLPLWGLASARNLGVGDLGDLAAAAAALGGLGADFLGINPVHARGITSRDASPYSPTSRVAIDPALIALDQVAGCEAAAPMLAAQAAVLAEARRGPMADHAARDAVLWPALRAIFRATRPQMAGVGALGRFALFEALSRAHGGDWRTWPEPLHDPGGEAAWRFAQAEAEEVGFHLWLQEIAAGQLAAAQARARGAGMRLGLYLDVAVGVRPGGADVWAEPQAFARGVSLGAPPDRFAPEGQRWNLAPFAPKGLRAAAYGPFRAMLQAAMEHAGIVRIDHVLGFRRAFWLPEDGSPGSYVDYPLETLLAFTRIEAARAGCVVVGEDLGTVPEGLREALAASGILGCAVTQFERREGAFALPSDYRQATLASLGTHDTPTLRGWWRGRDIELRGGIYGHPDEVLARHHAGRAEERQAMAAMLAAEGLPAGSEDEAAAALHRALAGAGSVLVAVQIQDALGAVEQQNLPGTVEEHPNWRRRLDLPVEAMEGDRRLRTVAQVMNARRGRFGPASGEG